ncbi:FRG domain-containing protein [Riemerella anatipestifer]|nr:FRG domain-containing protein [Riemerella anatipestifer]MDY3358756.1 FRG domain-containing protein [Riemerella anatipestifer]
MRLKKISQFISLISKLPSKNYFYRGHSDKSYDLKPSMYRKENFYVNEDKIYKETILNIPHEFYNCKSTIEVLVKMQHFGIPTRILDLTRNPLIALYFACIDNFDKDAEIIILDIPEKNIRFYDSDRITILANLAKQQVDFGFDIEKDFDYYDEDKVKEANDRLGYLLHSIKEDKPHFYNIINPNDLDNVLAVQVKLDNPRIIRQQGAFLIFGIQKSYDGINGKTNCSTVPKKWIVKHNKQRIIIPKEFKESLLIELSSLGINTMNLFPDLENIAKNLKSKYQ